MSSPASEDKVKPAEPPSRSRKRRRRATTTGAAEDCHTCRRRDVVCDRVRPFCGQCLELGKECSGYRTTLTWGVGVASRGKLRGRSLPIAKPEEKGTIDEKSHLRSCDGTIDNKSSTRTTPDSQGPPSKRQRLSVSRSADEAKPVFAHHISNVNDAGHVYPAENLFWQPNDLQQDLRTLANFHEPQYPPFSSPPQPYRRPQTSNSSPDLTHLLPSNIDSIFATMPGVGSGEDPSSAFFGYDPVLDPPHLVSTFAEQPGHTDWHAMSTHWGRQLRPVPESSDVNHPTQYVYPEPVLGSSKHEDASRTLWTSGDPSRGTSPAESSTGTLAEWPSSLLPHGLASSVPRSPFDMTYHHLPRRMQYLLDHYDKSICPFIFATDGPSNPYRKHIMPLALNNPGLQSAIAALSTNNIRMREVETRPWLMVATHEEGSELPTSLPTLPSKPTTEEQHYKAMSVEHLNSQLSDVSTASNDAVLATLLILCLFHVCNSGFSRFKTQLSGVQKLLKMRNGRDRSNFVGWVETFFAWFDVMLAAVNDRETEIHGDSLEMMDLSSNIGELEQFSGCEGHLFKLIARLSRLNLLCQNRTVRDEGSSAATTSQQKKRKRDLDEQPDTSESPLHKARRGKQAPVGENHTEDNRLVFWREWHDIRQRLWSWSMSPVDMTFGDPNPSQLREQHLIDISEAFRYSALLYTERLGYPHLPSSSTNLQRLVQKALSHIEAVGISSCVTKFMLWPLFITGTECVEERHRGLIRKRCVEIQRESGFYNNLSVLTVLEKVWRSGDMESSTPVPLGAQPFRWRKAMDRVDGEYIVV